MSKRHHGHCWIASNAMLCLALAFAAVSLPGCNALIGVGDPRMQEQSDGGPSGGSAGSSSSTNPGGSNAAGTGTTSMGGGSGNTSGGNGGSAGAGGSNTTLMAGGAGGSPGGTTTSGSVGGNSVSSTSESTGIGGGSIAAGTGTAGGGVSSGGTTSSTGGYASTNGGAAAAGTTSAAGTGGMGGTLAVGGNTATGGVVNMGGTLAVGGNTATGGVVTTGGTSAVGGNTATGGVVTTGGTQACAPTNQRTCAAAGLLGSCAAGNEICDQSGNWGPCSIQSKASDTCQANNDDNCNGSANDGCSCINGNTQPCGTSAQLGQCKVGTQTCANGAYGDCIISNVPDGDNKSCDDGNFITTGDKCVGGVCVSGSEDPTLAEGTIAGGGYHTCAIRQGAHVYCWGTNVNGQLGQDNSTISSSPTPLEVPGITDARLVTAGNRHTCALRATGEVLCWGQSSRGELGRGASVTGVGAISGLTASSLSAGYISTCAVASGKVWCWGSNSFGQLGTGDTNDSSVPVQVASITDAVQVAASVASACAVTGASGTVYCWGDNLEGELGNGTTINSLTPTQVTFISTPLLGAAAIATGGYAGCARLATNQVDCWGPWPTQISNFFATSVSMNYGQACARTTDGTVACWGDNAHGELGTGQPQNEQYPVVLSNFANNVSAVAAGGSYNSGHSCVRLTTGKVYCWGSNLEGQLGNGTNSDSTVPLPTVDMP